MTVAQIVTRLDSEVPALAQVLAATPGGNVSPVASGAALYALLAGLVGGRVYPVTMKDAAPDRPHIVYQIVASVPGEFEGYIVTHSDRFIVNLRGPDYDALAVTLLGAIVTALAGASMQITDRMDDYDAALGLYRVNIEVMYTFINAAAQTLPAAFVYALGETGGDNLIDAGVQQHVTTDYAIVLVSAGGNIQTLRDSVRTALLGWQPAPEVDDFTYQSGASIQGAGPLEVWREVYSAGYYIREA